LAPTDQKFLATPVCLLYVLVPRKFNGIGPTQQTDTGIYFFIGAETFFGQEWGDISFVLPLNFQAFFSIKMFNESGVFAYFLDIEYKWGSMGGDPSS